MVISEKKKTLDNVKWSNLSIFLVFSPHLKEMFPYYKIMIDIRCGSPTQQ